MFNSNFSIVFISKMVALNSAASFPGAGLIFRQQSIFPCVFPSGGSDFFGSWFILLFVFPLCHTSSLALFGFYYVGIYSPYERTHPYRRVQSIFQRWDLGAIPVSTPAPFQHVLLERVKARRHPLLGTDPNFQNLLSR